MEHGISRREYAVWNMDVQNIQYGILKVEQNMLYRTLRMEYNKCGMECGMIVSNIENVEWN